MKVKESIKGNFVATEKYQADILKCLLDVALQQDLQGIIDPQHLPKKYLPPGKRSELYHVYLASCLGAGEKPASVKTFYRCFAQSGYEKILRFRHRSQHAQCSVCHQLKAGIAGARDFVEHAKYCDEYHRHLGGMFADRKVYSGLRVRVTWLSWGCYCWQP